MTPYLEIGGDYRQVLPGVQMLELPLPFSLGVVNVYLVGNSCGYLLIDSGMETENCMQAFNRAREGLGVAWNSIKEIVLTHMHPDHIGLAPKLLRLSGARLLMHAEEVRLLDALADGAHPHWLEETMRQAGVPSDLMEQMRATFSEILKSFPRLMPDCTLRGGETLPSSIGMLEVLWTPGHSPGHVCLYGRERRVLFSGDHILEHITPNIGWQPGRDALGEFLDSLDRVASLEIDLILPAHGAPFTGHREWIRRTIEHHRERCHEILVALKPGPGTAHHLVGKLWDRELSAFHYRFALYEVLAHLEYLRIRGRVRARSQNGALEWSIA